MLTANQKYQAYPTLDLQDRTWPSRQITEAPIWCSVDLRDGNQALLKPMNMEKKLAFFEHLVAIGFKEIEIGFPSASKVEFDFARRLIEENRIPEDVTIQVLVQAREHLIAKTAEALQGAKSVIVHLYNSTSKAQRDIVFDKSQEEIKQIALQGVEWVKHHFSTFKGNLRLEYSPESFTGTELTFSAEICNAVINAWGPTTDSKIIINLPATVEMATPNIYADQIEWMIRNLDRREAVHVSLHCHNDRGTAVAATELALMSGADRVEGTLLGNGERTGNVDIITLGLNMYTQGVDPKLDFSNVDKTVSVVEACTEIGTGIRHPYVGKMVYTAFSGSHQDAINKGLAFQTTHNETMWNVPYLPIDPADVGRTYEDLIQINSQSGKGGVAYILEQKFGYALPKKMHPIVGKIIQDVADKRDNVVNDREIKEIFESHYFSEPSHIRAENLHFESTSESATVSATVHYKEKAHTKTHTAKGPVEAMKGILEQVTGHSFDVSDFHEHALNQGADAIAVAYVGILDEDGKSTFGVAKAQNITLASVNALINAIEHAL